MGHGARGLFRHGDCWDYFPHDHARSRAYRWGEDGLLGISDRECRLCFALALWNGKDPILKERLFGLTGPEGNHGEDVKEVLLLPRLDADAFLPEGALQVSAGGVSLRAARRGKPAARTRRDRSLNSIDTGVFDDDRYFDVFAEYAKGVAGRHPDSHHVANRGPEDGDAASAADALVSQHLVVGQNRRGVHEQAVD